MASGFQRSSRPKRDIDAVRQQTDIANGKLFVRHHGADVRYIPKWDRWATWSGRIWKVDDEGGNAESLAKETAERMFSKSLRDEIGGNDRDELFRHLKYTSSVRGLTNMLHAARSEPAVIVDHSRLDADPYKLAVRNGTIDLTTGLLHSHSREDLITRYVDIDYESDAACPRWERYLREITLGDESLVEYLRRAIGYSLSGDVSEQCLFILNGSGANGKGIFTSILLAMLGDMAATMAPDFLMVKSDAHPTELAFLHGRRIAVCTETEEGRRLAEVRVKMLSGCDPITARRMREDPWTFRPSHKLWVSTNHRPKISGTDYAIWRRIKLIPFLATFSGAAKDTRLLEKLMAELPAILAWAVRGCRDWYAASVRREQDRLREPAAVESAVKEYRSTEDVVASAISEICEYGTGDEYVVQADTLFKAYVARCQAAGERHVTSTMFGRRMKDMPGIEKDPGRIIHYLGIRLRAA